jgi:hypothetical protein
LGRQRLELLAILFADRVETTRQRVTEIGGGVGVGLGDTLNSLRVDAATVLLAIGKRPHLVSGQTHL